MTLNRPTVHQARPQLFYNWLKQNDRLGGQNKIPRLANTRDFHRGFTAKQRMYLASQY